MSVLNNLEVQAPVQVLFKHHPNPSFDPNNQPKLTPELFVGSGPHVSSQTRPYSYSGHLMTRTGTFKSRMGPNASTPPAVHVANAGRASSHPTTPALNPDRTSSDPSAEDTPSS